MKLSKEELSAKINELDIDEEVKISLLEDIADSVDVEAEPQENGELEELKIKYDFWKASLQKSSNKSSFPLKFLLFLTIFSIKALCSSTKITGSFSN